MTMEEALLILGTDPIAKSQYSNALYSLSKAMLGKRAADITKETPAYVVLSKIYEVTNPAKRDAILTRNLGAVRSSDKYKQVVVGSAIVMVIIAVIIAMIEVFSDTPVSADYADVFKTAVQGFFEVLKIVLSPTAPAPSE